MILKRSTILTGIQMEICSSSTWRIKAYRSRQNDRNRITLVNLEQIQTICDCYENKTVKQALFKECPGCKLSWNSRNEFLTDAKVTLTDYRVNFMNLEKGQFLFEHVCGETLTLEVNELSDLYGGPIYQERKTDSDDCPAYCLYVDSLEPCPEKCECAYAREILQLLR